MSRGPLIIIDPFRSGVVLLAGSKPEPQVLQQETALKLDANEENLEQKPLEVQLTH